MPPEVLVEVYDKGVVERQRICITNWYGLYKLLARRPLTFMYKIYKYSKNKICRDNERCHISIIGLIVKDEAYDDEYGLI